MNTILKKITYLLFALLSIGLSSCLKNGLDDLPAFDQAAISNVFLEHRFYDPADKWIDGSSTVKFQRLVVSKRIVAATSGTQLDSVIITPTVPKPTGSFTTEERLKVTLENIVVYMNISTAATISPLDGAPVLGKPGDFSSPRKYKVMAADGKTYRDWVIVFKPLTLAN